MSRSSRRNPDLEDVLHGDRSIPWEKAASYFVRVKKASLQKKADMGAPQSQAGGDHMGGVSSNYGKVDPGTLTTEGVRERPRPQPLPPNIHDEDGDGSQTPEALAYARAMERVQQDVGLDGVQAENEAAFYQQQAQEAAAAAEQAQMAAEQAQQAAATAQQQMSQVQQQADATNQQAQMSQQQMGQNLQMSQQESMAANEELMRLKQGIQGYRQQLQQLALSDPTAPPPMAVDPATGQPMPVDPNQAAATSAGGPPMPGQPMPGQPAPGAEMGGQEQMPPKQGMEEVPPMLAAGGPEMPPGMQPGMQPGEEEEVPQDLAEAEGLDLENMEDEELMELMDAIQGEIELRDQEDEEAEAQAQRQEAEANDSEHQQAMGLAESAVAASKSKGADKTAAVNLVRDLWSARRPFVKAADAINYVPPRRYGIATDHTPGQLEKNSDLGTRAAGAAIGGLAAAGLQSLSDRPGKDGRRSDKEIVLGERLKEMAARPDKGVLDRYKEVGYRAQHDVAKINRENPRVGAALAGLTGATAGAIAAPSVVRGLRAALAHFGRK